jgi:ubiquinone/menaquinone biosynthesis C-methylase UbiE
VRNLYKQALGHIDGGRVLDVATGGGTFVGTLRQSLQSYAQIMGIDLSVRALRDAQRAHPGQDSHFLQMDAGRLAFCGGGFDTVCAAKSLHHWPDPPHILAEMVRLLGPEGHLVVSDMHRDVETEPQRTDMLIHHLGAEVHTFRGFTHRKTYARQQIVALIEGLGPSDLVCYDWYDTDSDPMEPEGVREKDMILDRILHDARGMPSYQGIEKQATALRQRLFDTGIQSEPVLLVVAEWK